jgi:hypothetical protein
MLEKFEQRKAELLVELAEVEKLIENENKKRYSELVTKYKGKYIRFKDHDKEYIAKINDVEETENMDGVIYDFVCVALNTVDFECYKNFYLYKEEIDNNIEIISENEYRQEVERIVRLWSGL